jgi:hypothetical protein
MDLPWVNIIWSSHYVNKIPHSGNLCICFWWKDVLKLVDNFKGVVTVKHGNCNTFLFLRDDWLLNGQAYLWRVVIRDFSRMPWTLRYRMLRFLERLWLHPFSSSLCHQGLLMNWWNYIICCILTHLMIRRMFGFISGGKGIIWLDSINISMLIWLCHQYINGRGNQVALWKPKLVPGCYS